MTNTTLWGQGVMAPTISGTSAKQKPRGVNPGMAAGGEGPLSQTSNIIIQSFGTLGQLLKIRPLSPQIYDSAGGYLFWLESLYFC